MTLRKISLALVASATFFIGSAFAQSGTVTNHAFALGKGAGVTGYTSLLCGSAQLAVGQAAADPICVALSGDVTMSAGGVTAIGAGKVVNAMLGADVFSTAHTWSGAQTFSSTVNKLTLTAPATGATVSFADNSVFNTSGAFTTTLASTGATFATLPSGTHTLVGQDTTDTLSNKTFDTAGIGNVFKIAGTQISAITGTGSAVLATSPTLITPNIGNATATSVNKITITQPASSATLTIANGATLQTSGSFLGVLGFSGATTANFPSGTHTIVGQDTIDTLTNKTFDTAAASGNSFKINGSSALVTAANWTAALNAVVGDSGSGGTKGLVPAPAAGDAAAAKFLKADGSWAVPAGGGGGSSGHIGFYAGLQPLKLANSIIGVNPGSFADSTGTLDYSSNAVLTADLSTAVIGNSVTAATIANAGSSGTAGTQTVTVVGGAGAAATLSVTIASGGITAINSITNAGNYTTFPSNPAAVSGAGLVGATVNLTASSQLVGGMLSPGALSTSGTTTDGTDVMLYLVKRNSDGKLALVGDNSNVYAASLQATISNGSNSWSTGGPQTGFWNGTRVRLTSTGTFPTGFAANTDYWVVSETAGQNSTTFGLASSFGGSAITASSTFSGAIFVHYGVQDHLDAVFGAGTWTVLRRVHFAFRWKWQWTTSSGGIPDFTSDPRSDRVTLTYGGQGFALTVPSSGAATSYTNIDCSAILSNLNRIGSFRAVITSTGSAGTVYLSAPSNPGSDRPVGEGPTSGVTTIYGTAEVQTDSSGFIQYKVGGGSKLNALYLEGWTFVDPS